VHFSCRFLQILKVVSFFGRFFFYSPQFVYQRRFLDSFRHFLTVNSFVLGRRTKLTVSPLPIPRLCRSFSRLRNSFCCLDRFYASVSSVVFPCPVLRPCRRRGDLDLNVSPRSYFVFSKLSPGCITRFPSFLACTLLLGFFFAP